MATERDTDESMEPITFEVDSTLKRQIETLAAETERSVSGLLRLLVRDAIQSRQARKTLSS